jgi:regulator of replication initiation timing
MARSLLVQLSQKVHQASSELVSLKKERERLLAELDLIREENRKSRRILREYGELIQERSKIKEKLSVLLEKLDRLKV